jgi:hypothetical protein
VVPQDIVRGTGEPGPTAAGFDASRRVP